ncbi:zinc-binding alcohol dehydrogenase family protein [Flavimarina sp. Hel_I_48]|uniref:zinc-binding alcohol dehydrogenase family protein n=1 Tax=Flavimarina sp. Hel_I_48 TaxID=1392488 RepID=UPI0004DF9382|nr:zinc-binding alcohol dehydrogenase family protein [Flavimarina sp. Hel_I_48]
MKAIGFKKSLPINEKESFISFETETPKPEGRDLLVKIQAVSVNPVDTKIRKSAAKDKTLDEPKIIGWDAVGIVEAVGEHVEFFKKGDTVFYAGDLTRPGSNAEFQLVDERIVGHKPKNLSIPEAAAMPLTSLTAWETLFDRMRILREKDEGKSILIIGGAGGVGSIATQMAKRLAGLEVIATSSRDETVQWCKDHGADHVVNYKNLVENVKKAGFETVDFIVDFHDLNQYWDDCVELIKPQGHITSITGSPEPLELNKLKNKSVTFSWELMYTRSMFETEDMVAQHRILNTVAKLLDNGELRSTLNNTLQGMTVDNFKAVHAQLESGKSIGKTVIEY